MPLQAGTSLRPGDGHYVNPGGSLPIETAETEEPASDEDVIRLLPGGASSPSSSHRPIPPITTPTPPTSTTSSPAPEA